MIKSCLIYKSTPTCQNGVTLHPPRNSSLLGGSIIQRGGPAQLLNQFSPTHVEKNERSIIGPGHTEVIDPAFGFTIAEKSTAEK